MHLSFDHLVVKVNDLKQAIKSFSQAGFTVTNGGTHKGGLSENALIYLEDGAFIELLSMKKGLRTFLLRLYSKTKSFMSLKYSKKWGLFHRFYDRALTLPEGITDFCLLTASLSSDLDRTNKSGLFVTKPLSVSRKRPDGSLVEWEMASTLLAELPFLRGPYSPPVTSSETATAHANGISGISAIYMLALDYKEIVKNLSTLLNTESEDSSVSGNQQAMFQIGSTTLTVKKSSEHDDLARKFRGKGIGIYAISWQYKNGNAQERSNFPTLHGLVVH